MAVLVAQGEKPEFRWRRTLPVGQEITLGRTEVAAWSVPWDLRISRKHVAILYRHGHLFLRVLPEARNPVFFRGSEVREAVLRPNDRFVIGTTTFTFLEDLPSPHGLVEELVYREIVSPEHLEAVSFQNPDRRLEVLSRLPEVIAQASDIGDLSAVLVRMLLSGIVLAEVAAVVRVIPEGEATEGGMESGLAGNPPPRGGTGFPRLETIYWDERQTRFSDFEPSRRLVREAVTQQQTVLHIWRCPEGNPAARSAAGVSPHFAQKPPSSMGQRPIATKEPPAAERPAEFTMQEGLDWAFCTPVIGETSSELVLYVAGSWPQQLSLDALPEVVQALKGDMKFARITASIVAALRDLSELERRQSQLRQFFPQALLRRLGSGDLDELLAPRETVVTVLFCDLRGFSREAERHAANLMHLLDRVSSALGVMSRAILREGGVIGDFHGDAAMGFWGWPLADKSWIPSVCRAALAIRREFQDVAQQDKGPLAGFHVGIGIATGPAVAGKIGTEDQVKVTVFGPVVNLASRLEGLTKIFRVPILVDERTAQAIRTEVPPAVARVRRLARVRPYGLDRPVEIAELRPPVTDDPVLSDEHISVYEHALDAFLEGNWTQAYSLLRRLPSEDTGADFLLAYIVQHNRIAPPGWDGVIVCQAK
ncbi:MAG: adenylate/guanylate cyclase domain-containing protein [Thermoguttaceae bacterium]|nr:adenylate/guanylate cyclase domain-containing protein [Thermoguttaceae bacterium]MDW8077926.1 adenylate/guanylate cyclase domain-containing protein [Thermoguttaceae bacterium]